MKNINFTLNTQSQKNFQSDQGKNKIMLQFTSEYFNLSFWSKINSTYTRRPRRENNCNKMMFLHKTFGSSINCFIINVSPYKPLHEMYTLFEDFRYRWHFPKYWPVKPCKIYVSSSNIHSIVCYKRCSCEIPTILFKILY